MADWELDFSSDKNNESPPHNSLNLGNITIGGKHLGNLHGVYDNWSQPPGPACFTPHTPQLTHCGGPSPVALPLPFPWKK